MKSVIYSKQIRSVASLCVSGLAVLVLMQNCAEPLPVDESKTSSSLSTNNTDTLIGNVIGSQKTCHLNGITYQADDELSTVPVTGANPIHIASAACPFSGSIVRHFQNYRVLKCDGGSGIFVDVGVRIGDTPILTESSTCVSEARPCGSTPHGGIVEQTEKKLVELSCSRHIWSPNANVIYSEEQILETPTHKNTIKSKVSYGSYGTKYQCIDGTLTAIPDQRPLEQRFAPDPGQPRCSAATECYPSNAIKMITGPLGTQSTLTIWSGRYGSVGDQPYQSFDTPLSGFTGNISLVNGQYTATPDFGLYTGTLRCENINGVAAWNITQHAPFFFEIPNFSCATYEPNTGFQRYECK